MMRPSCKAVLLAATTIMMSPLAITRATASGTPATTTVRVRVYDPYRRDYHVWDRREERTYHEYLEQRHRAYLAYRRQSLAERRAYWRWRHEREERLEHERR